MKKVLLAICILAWMTGHAQQNLVPNGGFEISTWCPNALGQLDYASPWFSPTSSSPDYFSTCATSSPCWAPSNLTGYQYPRSGNAYAGIVLQYPGNYREYLGVALATPLVAGTTYMFRMSMVCSDIYQSWSGNIGVYFSNTQVQVVTSSPLLVAPQIRNNVSNIPDTLNWMTVTGIYTALGGEQYMIIGNFDDDAATHSSVSNPSAPWPGTYVYIDDVSLVGSNPTGINEISTAKLNAFPNPATTDAMITLNYAASSTARDMMINDVNGNIIAKYNLPAGSTHVNLPQMAGGIYVARIDGIRTSDITRFIVQ
jgi:hypothetical protein